MRLACGDDDIVQVVANPESFLKLTKRSGWDVLIVDPELADENNLPTFLRRLSKVSQPLVIYTTLSRVPASAVASLSARKFAGVILRDYEDSPDMLRNAFARVPIEFFGAQLVERLGSNVDALPIPLRRATVAAFCSAGLLRTAVQYAGVSGLTRRSVDRWLRRVRLSPAKWIVSTAQFLRAYPLIRVPDLPFAAVSRLTGYGSIRALRHNALLLTGSELAYLRTNGGQIHIIDLMESALRI